MVALPVAEQGESASSEMITMGGVPSVPEKESVMVLVLPTLFATAAQIWV